MASSSALPKCSCGKRKMTTAKKTAAKKPKKLAKYAHLPPDLRGAAKFLDEKRMIMDVNKALNKDGRVEVPLPRGDNPEHVGRVLSDITKRLLKRTDPGRGLDSVDRERIGEALRGRSVAPRPVQHGGSSSSTAPDPLGLFS